MIGTTGRKRAVCLASIFEVRSSRTPRDEVMLPAADRTRKVPLHEGGKWYSSTDWSQSGAGGAGKAPRAGAVPVGWPGGGEGIVSKGCARAARGRF